MLWHRTKNQRRELHAYHLWRLTQVASNVTTNLLEFLTNSNVVYSASVTELV